MTPLHRACESGNIDTIEFLLQHGANVNARSTWVIKYGGIRLFFSPTYLSFTRDGIHHCTLLAGMDAKMLYAICCNVGQIGIKRTKCDIIILL